MSQKWYDQNWKFTKIWYILLSYEVAMSNNNEEKITRDSNHIIWHWWRLFKEFRSQGISA